MKTLLLFLAMTTAAFAAETPDQLATLAASGNPELRFYEKQVAALPKPLDLTAPEIAQPLDFPSREAFRAAVLDLDAGLARLYLEQFRFVLAGETRLRAMEFAAASEEAAIAKDLADRISALVKMLAERPSAGVESLIERRILEGAALPFVKDAAELSLRAKLLKAEINGLTGQSADAELSVTDAFDPPHGVTTSTPTDGLLQKIRTAEIERGISGLGSASEIEAFSVGGWFTRGGIGAADPLAGVTHPRATSGSTSAQIKKRLLADAQSKLTRESARRELALEAAMQVVTAVPPKLIENLAAASDLAERQYRVGALGVNQLIEIHHEYLNAVRARNEAVIQAWRNHLDQQLLALPAGPSGKITVTPKTPQQ
jgi:cobalt-zinc-cadmium efflux system outer membrane protein